MSAARPQVNIMAPQAKKEYFGFSLGSPRTILPYLEKARNRDSPKIPRPMMR